ncbi:MAG: hypothetical protein K0R91_714, partial [Nitrososphaeraceae archaeon]|nr:hypothetical protein [Nitrososphaeraceae archaeon]
STLENMAAKYGQFYEPDSMLRKMG